MSLFYRVPTTIKETLEWKTDILTSRNGTEQRISIRERPRVMLDLSFNLTIQQERQRMWKSAQENMANWSDVLFWQYPAKILAASASGSSTVTYDYEAAPVEVGAKVAIVSSGLDVLQALTVDGIAGNVIHFSSPLTVNVTQGQFVCPIYTCYVSSMKNKIEGIVASTDVSIQVPDLYTIGSSASVTLETFNSIVVLSKRQTSMEESLRYEVDITDFETGRIDLFSPREHFDVNFSHSYFINVGDMETLKYWRKFFDTVRGSWKSFLYPTYLKDIVPISLTKNTGSFDVLPTNYNQLDEDAEFLKRFEIQYSDGSISRHTVTSVALSGSNYRFSFTPNLPNDDKVQNIQRVSRLLRVYLSDTVSITHSNEGVEISFSLQTTDT